MVLFGLFVGNNAKHLPTDPVWLEGTHGWYLVVLTGIACLGAGLTSYVGLQGRPRGWVLPASRAQRWRSASCRWSRPTRRCCEP
jgi:hypothetical protein